MMLLEGETTTVDWLSYGKKKQISIVCALVSVCFVVIGNILAQRMQRNIAKLIKPDETGSSPYRKEANNIGA